MSEARRILARDLEDIRRGVRKLYDGPGTPHIEVGEKVFTDAKKDIFFDHHPSRVCGRDYDLADLWTLEDVWEMGRRDKTSTGRELQLKPGFIFDLYVYEGGRPEGGDHGDMWGNVDAEWTGTEWRFFITADAIRNRGNR